MLKNLKVGAKLLVLTGILLALMLITLIWGLSGLSTTVDNGKEMAAGNALRSEFLARELDHLNWTEKVSTFLSDTHVTELNVEEDHTKCGLGQFLYGERRKHAEEFLPQLAPGLKALEKPHQNLHESVKKIKSAYKVADAKMPQFLTARELDLIDWVNSLQAGIQAGDSDLQIEFDHTKSSLGMFLYGEQGKSIAATHPELGKILEQIKEPYKRLYEQAPQIQQMLATGEQFDAKMHFEDEVSPTLHQVRDLLKEAVTLATDALKGQELANQIFATETHEELTNIQNIMHTLEDTVNTHIISDKEMISAAVTTRSALIVIGLFATAIGLALAWLIARSITRPVQKSVAMANNIAMGDLTQRLNLDQKDEIGQLAAALDNMVGNLSKHAEVADTIARGDLTRDIQVASGKDQLGSALRTMLANLRDMVGGIQVAGVQIASGSDQVSSTSQSLSQGATESAASLEEVTSSMNEMAGQVRSSAGNASTANQLSSDAQQAAEKGNSQMAEMVTAMAEINQAGQNISKIIKVIDEIAFQTNLLALNAAVEAARAGQHGKGFAVVAEEVRNLAARSAKAAEETAELIEGSVQLTDKGSRMAQQTETGLKDIMAATTKVSDLLEEIAAASNEQAQGINEVTTGLGQIDQVTQQNTASAEECAAAAEELSSQAAHMQDMLTKFKLDNATHQQPQLQGQTFAPSATTTPAIAKADGWGISK